VAIIDAARLKAFHAQHPELVEELVELFAASTAPLIDDLEQATIDGDPDLVRQVAHQLQGGSRSVGAELLANMAHRIEIAEAASPDQLDALRGAFEMTRDAFTAAIN
jgi:HPt (histidine-containing phosphotransfer) domain-containing protein